MSVASHLSSTLVMTVTGLAIHGMMSLRCIGWLRLLSLLVGSHPVEGVLQGTERAQSRKILHRLLGILILIKMRLHFCGRSHLLLEWRIIAEQDGVSAQALVRVLGSSYGVAMRHAGQDRLIIVVHHLSANIGIIIILNLVVGVFGREIVIMSLALVGGSTLV